MAIKKITLENYKCFSTEQVVNFTVPTSVECSGLNILVGENNSGKTATISSILKLKEKAVIDKEEKFNGNDVKLVFTDEQGHNAIIKNIPAGAQTIVEGVDDIDFNFKEIHFIKDNRIWTSGFRNTLSEEGYNSNQSFKRQDVDSNLAGALSDLEKNPEKAQRLDEFNVALKKIIPSFSKWTIDSTGKTGTYISYRMLNGTSQDIDFSLGSGILNLFRVLYGLIVHETAKIIIIDEPEAFLHPKAQEALSEILIKKSKSKQIIVATHSPYIFRKPIQQKANILLFKRKANDIEVTSLNSEFGLLGTMSPTYAEISFHAYGIYTPEFHNELYGFVHSKLVESKYISDVDDYLISKEDKKRDWIKDDGHVGYKGLSTYIRMYIHHPEQKGGNEKYKDQELIESTDFLIKCLGARDVSI